MRPKNPNTFGHVMNQPESEHVTATRVEEMDDPESGRDLTPIELGMQVELNIMIAFCMPVGWR
jgi:hypothetical protein